MLKHFRWTGGRTWLQTLVVFGAVALAVGCGDDAQFGSGTAGSTGVSGTAGSAGRTQTNPQGGQGGQATSGSGGTSTSAGGSSTAGQSTGGDQEPDALKGITAAHNKARAEVGVGPLVWDSALAAIAQAWADKCVDNSPPSGLIDHNEGRSDNYPGYVGENIYGSSNQSAATKAVDSWMSEKSDYNYDSNTCSGVCGHYTQVVWAKSTKLGCGMAHCAGLTYGYVIVCDYSPGGNSGGKPY
jgi:pathogenesis-related protein 1